MKTTKNEISNSNRIFKKAIKIIPTGSQSFSKGHTQFVDGVAPKFLDKGQGSIDPAFQAWVGVGEEDGKGNIGGNGASPATKTSTLVN